MMALAGHDEHGNPAAAAGAEVVFAELWHRDSAADNGSADGSAEGHKTMPLEVRTRPHGGFEVSAVLTAAGDFEVGIRADLGFNAAASMHCQGRPRQGVQAHALHIHLHPVQLARIKCLPCVGCPGLSSGLSETL
jgi:hypothetical protein